MSDVSLQSRLYGFREAPRSRAMPLDPQNLGAINGVELAHVPALKELSPPIVPVEYNCVVAPAVLPETTSGGIIKPDITRDTDSGAMQIGRLAAISEIAFNYDTWPEGGRGPPKVGEIVWFARYAGGELKGGDGRMYRIIKDKDINGIIPE